MGRLSSGKGDFAGGVFVGQCGDGFGVGGGHPPAGNDDAGHVVAGLAGAVDAVPFGDEDLFFGHGAAFDDLVKVQKKAGLFDLFFLGHFQLT